MFGRATIKLGIGPRSSLFVLCFVPFSFVSVSLSACFGVCLQFKFVHFSVVLVSPWIFGI